MRSSVSKGFHRQVIPGILAIIIVVVRFPGTRIARLFKSALTSNPGQSNMAFHEYIVEVILFLSQRHGPPSNGTYSASRGYPGRSLRIKSNILDPIIEQPPSGKPQRMTTIGTIPDHAYIRTYPHAPVGCLTHTVHITRRDTLLWFHRLHWFILPQNRDTSQAPYPNVPVLIQG